VTLHEIVLLWKKLKKNLQEKENKIEHEDFAD